MSFRDYSLGVAAGILAFLLGFAIGMNIYYLEPCGLLVPSELFAGAFPVLRSRVRELFLAPCFSFGLS